MEKPLDVWKVKLAQEDNKDLSSTSFVLR